MPAPLQWVSNIVPAKWFVLIARGIMLKGVGMTYLWRETLILARDGARAARRERALLSQTARL